MLQNARIFKILVRDLRKGNQQTTNVTTSKERVNTLHTGTMANSEDTDEMQHFTRV